MANTVSIQIPSATAPVSVSAPVSPGGVVKFNNAANAPATVNFGSKTPFCPQKLAFDVPPQSMTAKTVCANYLVAGTYNFSSTVKGGEAKSATLVVMTAPNPIVFPEKKPIVFPEDWVALVLGIGIGLLVGFLLGRRQPVRTTQR